jgi:type IV secretion system protein VirD4
MSNNRLGLLVVSVLGAVLAVMVMDRVAPQLALENGCCVAIVLFTGWLIQRRMGRCGAAEPVLAAFGVWAWFGLVAWNPVHRLWLVGQHVPMSVAMGNLGFWDFLLPILMLKVSLVTIASLRMIKAPPGLTKESVSTTFGSARLMVLSEAQQAFRGGGLVIGEAYTPSFEDRPGFDCQAGTLLSDQEKDRLSRHDPSLLEDDGVTHVISVGGTRSGKTSCYTIPTLLRWQGPVICNDPAKQVRVITQAYRESLGRKVVWLDSDDEKSASINILDLVDEKDPAYANTIGALISWFRYTDPGSQSAVTENSGYFESSSDTLLKCLTAWVCCNEGKPADLGVISLPAGTLQKLLKLIAGERHVGRGYPADLAGHFTELDSKQWHGIYGSAQKTLSILESEATRNLLSRGSLKFEEICSGSIDVFIEINKSTNAAQPALRGVVLGAILFYVQRRILLGLGTMRERLLLLLDEFDKFMKTRQLEELRDTAAKEGVVAWLMLQSIGQLEEKWGEKGAQSWLAACRIKTFVGVGDVKTAQYVRDMVSDTTVESRSTGRNEGGSVSALGALGQVSGSQNAGISEAKRELFKVNEIMQLKTDSRRNSDEQLVFVVGFPVAQIGLAKYYRRWELFKNCSPDPYYRADGVIVAQDRPNGLWSMVLAKAQSAWTELLFRLKGSSARM